MSASSIVAKTGRRFIVRSPPPLSLSKQQQQQVTTAVVSCCYHPISPSFRSLSSPANNSRGDNNEGHPKSIDEDINKDDWYWKPMTRWERVRHFPSAIRQLWNDALRCQNIENAANTKRNAWTSNDDNNRHHSHQQKQQNARYCCCQDFVRKLLTPRRSLRNNNNNNNAIIPRRQQEQQRRFLEHDVIVLPILLSCLIPTIGYLPMFILIQAPRQLLSRQFYNDFEIYQYAKLEYEQRQKTYAAVANLFWTTTTTTTNTCTFTDLKAIASNSQKDAAGPILDIMPLNSALMKTTNPQGMISSVQDMPREYLVWFALSTGIHQFLPSLQIAKLVTEFLSPTPYLQYLVQRRACSVGKDELLLLREEEWRLPHHHHDHDNDSSSSGGVASLTNIEVLDACLMRGLPVNISVTEMRRCLTNHLNMINEVIIKHCSKHQQQQQQQPPSSQRQGDDNDNNELPPVGTTEALGLLSLHLTLIRASLL